MFNLGGMKQVFTRALGFGTLLIKRHAPEICTYTGIVLGAVAAGLACKQTLVFVEVLEDTKKKIETVHDLQAIQKGDPEGIVLDEDGENHTYTSEDARRDLITVYSQTAVQTVKIYALPVGLGLLSAGLILGGHHILRKENAAVTAAYMALSESFKQYRKRVEADVGVDKDREYLYGVRHEEVIVQHEDGSSELKEIATVDPNKLSIYARLFGPRNPKWRANSALNLMFLRSQQNYANDLLHARGSNTIPGHVFLNEVLDLLGYPPVEAGQFVGWVEGGGDGYIDFGIYDPSMHNAISLDGQDDQFLLDFNVDGVILDIFDKRTGDLKKQR